MLQPNPHLLLQKNIAEGKTNFRKLYEKHLLVAKKLKFVVALDEA